MKQFNFFSAQEFYKNLSPKELADAKLIPLSSMREELHARLNILRSMLGMPIVITSWYRDKEHNNKTPGSSPTSQHLDGTAVDIKCADNSKLLTVIRKSIDQGMDYGQIIQYGTGTNVRFVHISLPTRSALNQFISKP